MICKNVLPFCGLSFHFLGSILCNAGVLNLVKSTFPIFLLLFVLLVFHLRSERFTVVFPFRGFVVLALTFWSLVHFELISIYSVEVGVRPNALEHGYSLVLVLSIKGLFFPTEFVFSPMSELS